MNYDALRQQERLDADMAKEREASEEKERQRASNSVEFDRLDRLMNSEDFNWFVAKHWLPLLTDAHDSALNTDLTAEKRNEFAHRHAIADTMLMALQKEHQRIKALLEEP